MTAIGSALEGPDHHCGYYLVPVGEVVVITANKQMVTFGTLVVDGAIVIDGQLISEL